MATVNKIDLNGDTYDIESSALVTTQPTTPSEGAVYYDTVNDVVKVYDGTNWNPISGGGGSGDVVGPNSSTNGHVAVFDGTTGKVIKDGGAVPRIIDVTVTTAATTPAKVGTTTEGNYTPTAGDLLLVNFVNGCGVTNPTLNIDGTGAKYIRTGNANANTGTFALGTTANSNIKALLYYDGEFYRCWSTSNATYSTMPVAEGKTGTSTNSRTISAANLKEIIKYHAVSDTAYGSTRDGVTDIAPSKNAVYDKIESLNLPIVSSTAPSSPTEGMIWYDTTNDKLKTYNGSSWDEAGSGGGGNENVKYFELSSQSDLTTAQEIYDWNDAGGFAIILYNNVKYYNYFYQNGTLYLMAFPTLVSGGNSDSSWGADCLLLLTTNGEVTTISQSTVRLSKYLATDVNYSTPYTPQYDGSPATKKYVDDGDTVVSGDSGVTYTIKVSNSAPASGTPNTTITFVV